MLFSMVTAEKFRLKSSATKTEHLSTVRLLVPNLPALPSVRGRETRLVLLNLLTSWVLLNTSLQMLQIAKDRTAENFKERQPPVSVASLRALALEMAT